MSSLPQTCSTIPYDEIEKMSAQQLGQVITQLQQELSRIQGYALSQGISAGTESDGTATNLTTYEQRQQALIGALQENIGNLTKRLLELQNSINNQASELKNHGQDLDERQAQLMAQQRELENKRKLVTTRNRMLQLSMEQNVYKKKVIYTLISAIIAVIILMLVGYSFMNKKSLGN